MSAPTPAQDQVLRAVLARLAARWPATEVATKDVYQHSEDEETGWPPLYSYLHTQVDIDGLLCYLTSSADGESIEVRFYDESEERTGSGPYSLLFLPEQRKQLYALGWQRLATWEARWPATDVEPIVNGLQILAQVNPEVLRPADLPEPFPWPRSFFIRYGLLADEIVNTEVHGTVWRIDTRLDGKQYLLEVSEANQPLVTWWKSKRPTLRRFR